MVDGVLVRYDAMLQSIAECKAVDEILQIENNAEALRQAARVSGNTEAEADMAEIRFRAERRLGQLIKAQGEAGLLAPAGRKKSGAEAHPINEHITLTELGIDKRKADRVRKMAAVPEREFNGMVGDYKRRVKEDGEKVAKHLIDSGAKHIGRQEKYDALAARIEAAAAELPTMGPFGVIYADPPWQFETRSEAGMDRSEANHYPTVPTADIIKLQPPAFKDAALALWAISPMLDQALDVLRAWDFTYKANMVWRKYGDVQDGTGSGTGRGYWFRVDHEHLLIGTRGTMPAPEPSERMRSVQASPPGINSAKPPLFRQMLDIYFPKVRRLEMFAREAAPGWERWGAEAPVNGPAT